MKELFNEIAVLANVDPIAQTVCTNDQEPIFADEAIRSEDYPDALFCNKYCRDEYYQKQSADGMYFSPYNMEV